jgi:hypothetical protein
MSAIRGPVTLTNSVDLGMVRRGILNPKHLRTIEVNALVDTGAVMLVIPNSIAVALGLEKQGQEVARYAKGSEELVNVSEPLKLECLGCSTTDEALIIANECNHPKISPIATLPPLAKSQPDWGFFPASWTSLRSK